VGSSHLDYCGYHPSPKDAGAVSFCL